MPAGCRASKREVEVVLGQTSWLTPACCCHGDRSGDKHTCVSVLSGDSDPSETNRNVTPVFTSWSRFKRDQLGGQCVFVVCLCVFRVVYVVYVFVHRDTNNLI